jgi:purine-cytosine permease-like protein
MKHTASNSIGRIAQWALMGLGVLFTIMIFTGSELGIDGGLWVTYIAMAVATVAAIGFSFTGLTKKSLIGIGAFLGLLLIAYLISDGSDAAKYGLTEGASKWVGAGLITMYVALFGAIGAIVYGEVTRLLK